MVNITVHAYINVVVVGQRCGKVVVWWWRVRVRACVRAVQWCSVRVQRAAARVRVAAGGQVCVRVVRERARVRQARVRMRAVRAARVRACGVV